MNRTYTVFRLRYFLLLLVASVGYAQEKVSSTFYRDLKDFSLEGIQPLKKGELTQYPYFELVQLSPMKKRMVLWFTSKGSETREFKKINGYWTYFKKEVENNEMDTTYTYQYYSVDKKLTLIYSGNPDGQNYGLGTVVIETKQTLENYSFPLQDIKIKPSPTIDLALKKIKKISTIGRFTIKGKILMINSTTTDMNGQPVRKSERCFNLEKWGYIHSIFWWSFFQGENISCQ